jgi:Putative peptidoglycan binding domain
MKKLISLLIGCSLALAGAALAQQPVEQQSPSKGKQPREKKAPAAEAKPRPDAAKPQEKPAKQQGAMKGRGPTDERAATAEPGAGKGRKTPASQEPATAPAKETDVSREAEGAPKPGAKQQAEQRKKEQAEQRKKGVKEPAAAAKATPAPLAPASPAAQANAQARAGAKAKKPDPQKVQQIKSQHATFRAQPKPQQVQAVTFNQNRRIERSETWQGPQYEVFRSYRPEWHDAGWYHSRYPNVTLIAGGYYFFNNGYWYPAWGYNPSAQYYAYDGPIYVGQRAQPPDQVIADVQAVLQEMGYYRGEVDGLLGPLTREALTAYQADNGLTTTAAIDQPTLDSLGMG